ASILTITVDRPDQRSTWIAYLAGNLLTLAVLGYLGSLLFFSLFHWSPVIYAVLGIYALYVGIKTLWKVDPTCHHHPPSHGLSFLVGSTAALSFQPCCGPLITAVLTLAPSPLYAAEALVCYGLAHNLSLLIGPWLGKYVRPGNDILAIVMGGLSITYGLLYVLIA
ncbi:MAG: hypothetical protein ACYDG3_06960, partial [Bacillati bacterium]